MRPLPHAPRNSEELIDNWPLKIGHREMRPTPQLPLTNFQWPILNCIFLFSLLLALPLASDAQTNSSAPSQPSPPAAPPSPPAEVANILYDFTMPVQQVLDEVYAPLVARTLLRPPGVNNDTLIKLNTDPRHPMTKSQAIISLETAMEMKGVHIVPVGEKFFKVVIVATGSEALGLVSSNAPSGVPSTGKFITKIVQLKYADQVVKALGLFATYSNSVIYIPGTQSLILRDYTDNVNRMLDRLAKLDVAPAQAIKSERIPILGLPAHDTAARIPPLGKTKIIVDERDNSVLVFANDENMKRIKQIISQDGNSQDIR
jgi:general secretion pathway protein D